MLTKFKLLKLCMNSNAKMTKLVMKLQLLIGRSMKKLKMSKKIFTKQRKI